MDKNFKNKFKNFFRKEAFYVVLFLCLCIIATVTTISYKISKQNELKSQSNSTSDKDLKITEDNKIRNEIPNSERVENKKTDTVDLGVTVKICYVDDDEEEEYRIVGSKEADPSNNKISNESPIAKSIIGAKVGEVRAVATPNGGSYNVIIKAIS